MFHLIGGRGRLGRALTLRWAEQGVSVLSREVYADWWRDGSSAAIARYFGANAKPSDTVCVLAGVLDPAMPDIEHERVNFALPTQVVEGALVAGLRAMTFGTIMERLVTRPNRYIASKVRLGQWVGERAARGGDAQHLRIHTLYGGGAPAPFMFLGQMLDALRAQRPFLMSSGRQLREYHHVDDDAHAIDVIAGLARTGVIELNHGAPLALRQLASGVFAGLGCEHLLQVGALPDPVEDNYGAGFVRPDFLNEIEFRDTVPCVVGELGAQLPSSIVNLASRP